MSPDNPSSEIAPLKGLSFLDRFLVIWIFLSMAVGILLANFVPSTDPALQKGEFVGVSIPIGRHSGIPYCETYILTLCVSSRGLTCHDVSNSLQSTLRDAPPPLQPTIIMGPDRRVLCPQLDRRASIHGRPSVGIPTRS